MTITSIDGKHTASDGTVHKTFAEAAKHEYEEAMANLINSQIPEPHREMVRNFMEGCRKTIQAVYRKLDRYEKNL